MHHRVPSRQRILWATRIALPSFLLTAAPALAQQGWTFGSPVASVNAELISEEASGPRINQCAPGKVATPGCAASDSALAWSVPPQTWPLFVQASPDCGMFAQVSGDASMPAVTIDTEVLPSEQGVSLWCKFLKRDLLPLQGLLTAACSDEDEGVTICGGAEIGFRGSLTLEAPFELCGPATISADLALRVLGASVDPDYRDAGALLHTRMEWAIERTHPWSTPDTVHEDSVELAVLSGSSFEQPGTIEPLSLDAGSYRLVLTLKAGSSVEGGALNEQVGRLQCQPYAIWASEAASARLRVRPFDLDGTGEIDPGDLALAMLDFGPCPDCSADLDGSGEVDQGDLSLILLNFGPVGCP